MVNSCVARCYVCNEKVDKVKNITLHTFPKRSSNVIRFKKWLHVLDLNEKDEVRTLLVCSQHFIASDYCNPSKQKRLKNHAVPSLNVPNQLPFSNDEPFVPMENKTENVAGPSSTLEKSNFIAGDVTPKGMEQSIEIRSPSPVNIKEEARSIGDTLEMDEKMMEMSPSKSRDGFDQEMTLDKSDFSDGEFYIERNPLAVQTGEGPKEENPTNTPTKGSAGRNRRFSRPRYVSEITPSDLVTLRRAEKLLKLLKKLNSSKSAKLQRLRTQNHRLRALNLCLLQAISNPQAKEISTNENVFQEEAATDNCDEYSLKCLRNDLRSSELPKDWVLSTISGKVILSYFGDQAEGLETARMVTCSISIKEDLTVEIRAKGKLYTGSLVNVSRITCKQDIFAAMQSISNLNKYSWLDDGLCCGEGVLQSEPRNGKCSARATVRRRKVRVAKKAVRWIHLKKSTLAKTQRKLQRKLRDLQIKVRRIESKLD